MSASENVCVQDLIPAEFDQLSGLLRADSKGSELSGIPDTLFQYASTEILSALRKTLDVGVFEWLTRAWCGAAELHTYRVAAPAAGVPVKADGAVFAGATATAGSTLLSLGEHTLSCNANPVVTVKVEGHSFRIDKFALHLEATLTMAELVIEHGCIMGVDGGYGTASATLMFGDHALHEPMESKRISVPGKIRFATPGYRIL